MFAEDIERALQVQDEEQAALLIDYHLAGSGFDEMWKPFPLRSWFERLSGDVLARYPLLCLHYAQDCAASVAPELPSVGMIEQIDELLQMADAGWRVEGNLARLGEVYAFRAYLAMRQGMQEQIVAYASQALRWLPLESQHWRGVCLNLLGARAIASEQFPQAIALLREALTVWANLRHRHGARSCLLLLATVYCEQGALQHAVDCYRHVIQEAREVWDREDLIPALLGLAQTLCKWSDMEAAEQAALEAWDESGRWQNQELLQRAASMLAKIWSLQGSDAFVKQRFAVLQAHASARPELLAVLQPFLQTFGRNQEDAGHAMANVELLSRQEQRVLRLLVAELSYADIARELVVSINTVKTQVSSIYRKLDVHTRREAQVVARRLQ